VRSGLALLAELIRLNESASHPRQVARIGIDSGAVVVGAAANAEMDVFGETPNVAARIQSVAEPGTVGVSANTHRLITGLFILEDKGPLSLKGIAEPPSLVSHHPTKRRSRSFWGNGHFARANAIRGPRRRITYVNRTMGTRLQQSRSNRIDNRRSRHRQIAVVASVPSHYW
jgi:Adenylate and Guanylate cyclase catalytic domain